MIKRIHKNKKISYLCSVKQKKKMKKTIILSIFLLFAGSMALAQESKVQHIDYNGFLSKIWDFEKNPNEFVFKGKTAAIVDFYADWCGPCRKVAPILEKLANEDDGQLTVYKVNVDQAQDLASAFQVRSIPTILFIPKKGQPMMQFGALSEADFRKVVEEQLLK